jgi:1,2-dihydroxy-3-keto-5-methylthiopentene dioxygenase
VSKLVIYSEDSKVIERLDSDADIAAKFLDIGVDFFQWQADQEITDNMDNEAILKAYSSQIDKLIKTKGYESVDVVSMHSDHPDKKMLREKFLAEHTHSEDEVRFFVKGSGLFSLHINGLIYSILCNKNDLISVPAKTPHWFDMGENPNFTAIRLFNNPDGWIANFTGDDIANRFPKLVLM